LCGAGILFLARAGLIGDGDVRGAGFFKNLLGAVEAVRVLLKAAGDAR
jgi:hypothetical protein